MLVALRARLFLRPLLNYQNTTKAQLMCMRGGLFAQLPHYLVDYFAVCLAL